MNPKIVVVEWVDATGHSDWVCKEDALKQEMCSFRSVGYLLQEDKEKIQIALTVGIDNKTVSNTLFIPKRCIKQVTKREIK